MKEVFVTTVEELEDLEIKLDLEDNGMSGKHDGWHWYQDDDNDVAVYFKIDDVREQMLSLENITWGSLSLADQGLLLEKALPIDGVTGSYPTKEGDCIVDFENSPISIPGVLKFTEDGNVVIIRDFAVFYHPTDR